MGGATLLRTIGQTPADSSLFGGHVFRLFGRDCLSCRGKGCGWPQTLSPRISSPASVSPANLNSVLLSVSEAEPAKLQRLLGAEGWGRPGCQALGRPGAPRVWRMADSKGNSRLQHLLQHFCFFPPAVLMQTRNRFLTEAGEKTGPVSVVAAVKLRCAG